MTICPQFVHLILISAPMRMICQRFAWQACGFSFRQYRLNHTCSKPSFFSYLYKNTMITIPFLPKLAKGFVTFCLTFSLCFYSSSKWISKISKILAKSEEDKYSISIFLCLLFLESLRLSQIYPLSGLHFLEYKWVFLDGFFAFCPFALCFV